MAVARYLYCIASRGERVSLGSIGIGSSEVYTIPYRDICAVVHDCADEPYNSKDVEKAKMLVTDHEKVVESAWKRFGTVLPLGLDTIIIGKEETTAEENMISWIRDNYDDLKTKFEKLDGKAEYGVQIFWDPMVIGEKLIEKNEEIKKISNDIKSKPRGAAYMYKQKLENLLKKQMETEAENCFRDFYERIKSCVDDIKVEKTKSAQEGKQMIMNLSCLMRGDMEKQLGDELEKIHNMEGFSVRFTGPWPPYSFA